MQYITGGLFLFFLLLLLFLLFHIWLEGKREQRTPHEITGESLPEELREAALHPLKLLNMYYGKRDPEQADACIDETILPDNMLILGTNPDEIFYGRQGAKWLLQGDWKHWGQLALDVEETTLYRADSALYYILRGKIKLDYVHFRIPIRITGTLEERESLWYISKMQFVNNLNSNYLVIAWIPAMAAAISLLLFGLSWLLP